MEDVDAIIIGSGQGGVPLAVRLAQAGKRVVLFERGELGGTCVNSGCTPSKAFLASAHHAGRARRAAHLGVNAQVTVDFPKVMDRVRGLVGEWRSGVEEKLSKAGVTVVYGDAAFSGVRTVAGGDREFRAPLVVINTGASAAIPGVPGLAGTPYLDNTSFFDQKTLPKRFAVLGGGYIGLELGQGMARVGSSVDILQGAARLVDNEIADIGAMLKTSLERDGVSVHLNTKIERVEYDGVFRLHVGAKVIEADAFLVAVGRTPNTRTLALGKTGVEVDAKGFVRIDDRFGTACEGVYAIADVAAQPAFTHVSWEDHRRLLDILAGGSRTRSDRVLAYAMFTEPQVGRVGLSLDAAKKQGYAAKSVRVTMDSVARALEWGEDLGFYELVADEKTAKILGATLVGYEAGELVHVFVAHIQNGATWHTLEESVHIHPTYCEAFPGLARMLA